METYYIEYGELEITYAIEGDCDGNHVFIKKIEANDIGPLDADDIKDIKFHCESDFADRQLTQYKNTGEII
ncbi:hypothetical protein [Mucilaginibacter xinganensis]|uniref:Uncharacterized protein n=1 Tax=Mucilaginibacter xinganensis TaxID=1234841 RepID=A0A223NX34_9SPHI|nr:hypothetical protein [Mucilaginibacter xinganensis]ASU34386.1 hypothetical protein MuYL_2499 [Mucilaginibacter xinganensis]